MPSAVMNGRQSIIGPARVISGYRGESDEFAIEENVPIPKRTTGKTPKYPVRDLEVGQSFFIEGGTRATGTACQYLARTADITIITRLVKQGAMRGLRVWRTA